MLLFQMWPYRLQNYFFSVVNTSSPLFNYNLHKTGLGNQTSPCEIRSSSALSSEAFRGDTAKNDITCYFDAEELSLLHGGMEFSVNSSANSCDYIGYSPFSFFDRIPGDSSGNYLEVECANETTVSDDVEDQAVAQVINIQAANGTMTCGDIVSTKIDPLERLKFQLSSDEELCRFNYEKVDGENCDIGVITVDTLTVTTTPKDDNNPRTVKSSFSKRTIRCGGKVASCIKGPIQNLTKTMTKATEINETVINQPFTKEYELEPLYNLENDISLKSYVNFRRNLASKSIDYDNPSNLAIYRSAFSSTGVDTLGITAKTFQPDVIDAYSKNKRLSSDPFGNPYDIITSGAGSILEKFSVEKNTYTAKPLAAEPFLGIPPYTTNPFYTFYCYDTAFDVKARIRMMVREWDRVSPSFNLHDFISDIGAGDANARQDSVIVREIDGDFDGNLLFNDLPDWDDHIPMMRTPGNFDNNTQWKPIPEGVFTEGFFNPKLFTNGSL